eukprot:scaffold9007_cov56-Phaeocystis_antarctica.AAC.1
MHCHGGGHRGGLSHLLRPPSRGELVEVASRYFYTSPTALTTVATPAHPEESPPVKHTLGPRQLVLLFSFLRGVVAVRRTRGGVVWSWSRSVWLRSHSRYTCLEQPSSTVAGTHPGGFLHRALTA